VGERTKYEATKHILWALNTPNIPQNSFLVYSEPEERVCWLQMSSYFC